MHDAVKALLIPQVFEIIADLGLTEKAPEQRVDFLEMRLFDAITQGNENIAVGFLDLLESAWQDLAKSRLDGKRPAEVHHHFKELADVNLRRLYWLLPQYHTEQEADSGGMMRNIKSVRKPVFVKFKLAIIKRVILGWNHEPNEKSIRTFRFLIAAFKPQPRELQRLPGESDDEMSARGRYVSDEEQEKILNLMRNHIREDFTDKDLKQWLNQPNIPEEIWRKLANEWARKVPREEFMRNLNFAGILDEAPAHSDAKFTSVIMLLQDIGQFCELGVIGAIPIVQFPRTLTEATLLIKIPKSCDQETTQAILGMTNKRIAEFFKKAPQAITSIEIRLAHNDGCEQHCHTIYPQPKLVGTKSV